jgi:hypothetical protein
MAALRAISILSIEEPIHPGIGIHKAARGQTGGQDPALDASMLGCRNDARGHSVGAARVLKRS